MARRKCGKRRSWRIVPFTALGFQCHGLVGGSDGRRRHRRGLSFARGRVLLRRRFSFRLGAERLIAVCAADRFVEAVGWDLEQGAASGTANSDDGRHVRQTSGPRRTHLCDVSVPRPRRTRNCLAVTGQRGIFAGATTRGDCTMPFLSRRDVLRTGVTATAGLLASTGPEFAADTKATGMTIIDTHQHLWDLNRFRLPWVKEGTILGRSYLLSDYHAAAAGTGIEKTVYMEVDVEPSQQRAEADFVVANCGNPETKMVAGVVSGRPAAEDFRDYIAGFRGSRQIKGVRQVLHVEATPPGYCLD